VADLALLTERMRLGFGVDLVVDRVAAGLAGQGHRVTVYAAYEDGTYRDRPYALEHLDVRGTRYAPLYDVRAIRRAGRFGLERRGHDLFLVHSPPFFALLPRLGRRAVVVDHGVVDARGFRTLARLNFAFTETAQHRLYFRYANRLVTVSEFVRDRLPANLQAKATRIHNGADHYPLATAQQASSMRRRLGVADGEAMVLYLGRLNPELQPYKGTADLLATWTGLAGEVPRARLVMAGFGDDSDAAWIRAGGGIPYTNVPVDDMPALLGAADLFVTASRWEGFNLNLVEAQRAGAAVVAFRVGAHPEVVDDGASGLLVESLGEFRDAWRTLLVDGDRRRRMGERAAMWASRFTWKTAVDRYDAMIAEVLVTVGRSA
jgi:glycosyltransferase involved in cell wall biosynthesis